MFSISNCNVYHFNLFCQTIMVMLNYRCLTKLTKRETMALLGNGRQANTRAGIQPKLSATLTGSHHIKERNLNNLVPAERTHLQPAVCYLLRYDAAMHHTRQSEGVRQFRMRSSGTKQTESPGHIAWQKGIFMKVENMKSPRTGNKVANQYVIIDHEDHTVNFQSYDNLIVKVVETGTGTVKYLDETYWDYSVTTGKYRNIFLGESKKETDAKIKSGEYILADLN